MMPLSQRDLAECRTEPAVAVACPTHVPEAVEKKGYAHRAFVNELGRRGTTYYVFNVEWGAPHHLQINPEDRPPRFSHIVVHAGDLDRNAFGFGWPGTSPPPNGQPPAESLGQRRWGPFEGELVLAPRYPFGGIDGSHLIFRWSSKGTEYAISMHAWTPVEETEAALRATVLSIP